MTISDADVTRFKKAFKGKVAERDTPLLAHKVKLPAAATSSDRVKKALSDLEAKLATMSSDATGKRTGTKALGRMWSKDKSSSLKETADTLDDEEVDLDALSNIIKGKGQAEAQAALNELKQAEKLIQTAVADELLDQAANATDALEAALRTEEVFNFLGEPGVNVVNAHDKAVIEVAKIIATCLRKPADWLKTATPDEICELYLDKLYGKLKMETKAARDPGVLKPLQNLLSQLDGMQVALLTPGGDAETMVNHVKLAKIGDTIALNQARAGKYSAGAQETRKKKVEAASDKKKTCEVAVQGNKRFADAVDAALANIGKTPAGAALLEAFAQTGKPLTITAPSVSSAQSIAPDGSMVYSNSGGKGRVALDPENTVAGDGGDPTTADREPWRKREASVALYHEMIHALIGNKDGGEPWTSPDDPTATLGLSEVGDVTELRIVGIDYLMDHKGKKVRFPFSDPRYNPITENAYRRELAKSNGETHFLFRPSYANVAGQVPLPTAKIPV